MIRKISGIVAKNKLLSDIVLRVYPLFHEIYFQFFALLRISPVLIYQMGKVGSTAVKISLKKSMPFSPIYHVHFLTTEGIAFLDRLYFNTYGRNSDFPPGIRLHLIRTKLMRDKVMSNSGKSVKYKIITLVRDPVRTNISGFFQNSDRWLKKKKQLESTARVNLDEIASCFLNEYPHHIPLRWFDDELKKVFHLNIFKESFPQNKGYKIYKERLAEVLLIKYEKLHEYGPDAFREFMNIKDFKLLEANLSNEKWYGSILETFVSQVVIPEKYLDRMYHSKLCTHFYSAKEIGQFRNRWRRKNEIENCNHQSALEQD